MTKYIIFLLISIAALAQQNIPIRDQQGTSLPATCTVGQRYFKTNATAGQNLYGCTATNTWTALGAGSGGSHTSGTYSSLPGSCTTGDTYMTTDGPYTFRCISSAWVAYAFGKSVTIPPQSGWTEVNKGGSDTTTYAGYISILGATAGSAEDYVEIVRTAPATPYTIEACFAAFTHSSNYSNYGMVFRQSSDGKFDRYGYGWDTSLYRQQLTYYSGPTTGITLIKQENPIFPTVNCFRIKDDGTNRKYYATGDGFTWWEWYTHVRTTDLTPDQVGFALGKSPINKSSVMLYHWYQF